MASNTRLDNHHKNDDENYNDPFADTEIKFKERGRPWVVPNPNVPKFTVDAKVQLLRPGGTEYEGPYWVATVDTASTPIKYKLCHEDGTKANGGSEVEEGQLSPL